MSAEAMILAANQTATIQRNTPTKDASGGNVDAWTNSLIGIPVFEQQMGGDEAMRYERETNRRKSRWFAFNGQDIRAKDRMIYGSRTINIVNADSRAMNGRSHLAYIEIIGEETT